MCAVLLDTKGPEIRTGTLKGGGPVTYTAGSEVTLTTNYNAEGDSSLIAISYKKLAEDVYPGSQILIADGSLVLVRSQCRCSRLSVRRFPDAPCLRPGGHLLQPDGGHRAGALHQHRHHWVRDTLARCIAVLL